MDPNQIIALSSLVALFLILLAGIPVGFSLAIIGFVFGYIGFGADLFNFIPGRIFGVVTNYTLLAIPLFVFMGVMLQKSRVAEDLLDVVGHLFTSLRGGMGLAVILIGMLMGAATGIVGATVVTLGLLALPTLLRRGYNKRLACGAICASGTLGQIIPPSLILIVLGDIMGVPVGTLFAAALFPGLLLTATYGAYMLIIGMVFPDSAPPIPLAERNAVSNRELALKVVKVLLPPLALITAVLGSIIGGIAAPTEAASVGALGSILVVAMSGRLTRSVLTDTVQTTTKISAMVMFILVAAQVFSLSFRGLGGDELVQKTFDIVPASIDAQVLLLLLVLFLLGFFLEWIEISYVALPLFLPVFHAAGVDLVWLATLVCLNLQTSYLTPPFGWALFFLKGVSPPQISTSDIYLGVIPFIGMQIAVLAMLFLFPGIATWLPRAIGW
ncbi:TRAP transporter large permease subunit [Limibacillus sp. MBR-115]|jgi:tripartite ATP-independent transporter DctM subunit|uniref:TRAP transporter large permease n=1 Tax=Limibacillus sp. MBR-115 TaxID=3156465 RepID=UPI0033961B7D